MINSKKAINKHDLLDINGFIIKYRIRILFVHFLFIHNISPFNFNEISWFSIKCKNKSKFSLTKEALKLLNCLSERSLLFLIIELVFWQPHLSIQLFIGMNSHNLGKNACLMNQLRKMHSEQVMKMLKRLLEKD
jgi:hypothetical protein